MKILVVEDDAIKKRCIEYYFSKNNIAELHFEMSVMPALNYVIEHLDEISGVILDLGLTSYNDSTDYDYEKGLLFVEELTRKEITIPILINSTTEIDLSYVMKNHKNVKGQTAILRGHEDLEEFLALLK